MVTYMMNNHTSKKTLAFLTAVITCAMALTSCGGTAVQNNENSAESTTSAQTTEGTTAVTTESQEETTENTSLQAEALSNTEKKTASSDLFSERDLNPDYSSITARITLSGDSVTIDGNGASAEGSIVTITEEGVYYITGTLDDGQIVVNADKAKVQLVLDNVNISCSASAAIYGMDSDKIFITLVEGSKNTLSDGSSYTYAEDTVDEPDACVFSSDSLTINGSGSLTVTGNYADGIRSKDDVVITGGTISVKAASDGIKGKDYIAVCDGNITVDAGEDGIKSTNATDEGMGFVYIEGGTFAITSGNDGIQAETDLIVTGGSFDITAGGGSANSTKTHADDFGGGMGGFGGGGMGRGGMMSGENGEFTAPEGMTPPEGFEGMTPPDGFGEMPQGEVQATSNTAVNLAFTQLTETTDTETSTSETSTSTKGIKGGVSIQISGGTFKVNSADDTVHSNGDVTISGGELTLEAGDDGIHADGTVSITDGKVNITKSYEGIEAATIDVSGGSTELHATDDGFNASDGTSQGAMGTYSAALVNISGGYVYVESAGDGLDSNGDMTISGGTVIVDGPENSGNGALDSNGDIAVTGGILVAAGMSGMAEYPGNDSEQNSVSATFDSTYSGGTSITLADESGNIIVSYAPSKTFNNIVISSPSISGGNTYTFYTDGTVSGTADEYGLYTEGTVSGGTEIGSFTAENITSFVGTQSMMGGRGGMGGDMTAPDGSGFGGRRQQWQSEN